MNITSNFTPTLYIGIGATGALFTLRETYLHWGFKDQPEVRSFHHTNLAQDADEAFAKAEAYSKEYGVLLKTTPETLAFEMREIQRASAQQLEERAKAEAEKEARRLLDYWGRADMILADQLAKLKKGICPVGRHAESPLEWLPASYASWLVASLEDFEEGSIIKALAEKVKAEYAHLILPTPDKALTIGEEKERREFTATVINATGFDGSFGWTNVITMASEEGACLVYMGTAGLDTDIGEKIAFKATIKKHDEYKGQAQTFIQRIKLS
jgi:hypothetical protein